MIEPGVDEIVEISSERERISLTFYWNVSFVSSRYNISLHSAYSTVEYLKECQPPWATAVESEGVSQHKRSAMSQYRLKIQKYVNTYTKCHKTKLFRSMTTMPSMSRVEFSSQCAHPELDFYGISKGSRSDMILKVAQQYLASTENRNRKQRACMDMHII